MNRGHESLLNNIKAIFDTGTTLIVGDPDGIEIFFGQLAPYGALPWTESPGYYTSTWANLATD